ncbi:MAG: FkbM family methyltransferase [Erythrobacter sp.]|nr:FkbM family methyltransferase [Erythrobacter sp.]
MKPFFGSGENFAMDWRGMKVWIDREQAIDMRLYATGDYEPETLTVLAKLATPNSVVIDIGANIGLVSMWLSQCVGTEGKVIAVEPSRWACDCIERNLQLSGISNVDVVHAAASDSTGVAELDVINGYRIDNLDTRKSERVSFVTVDEIIRDKNIDSISVLKIDTDGFEMGVFRGAHNTLSNLKPALVFEYGPDHLRKHSGVEPEFLISFLNEYDYEIYGEDLKPLDVKDLRLGENQTTNLVALHRETSTMPI